MPWLARTLQVIEPEASLRASIARATPITDDNMGDEWRAADR